MGVYFNLGNGVRVAAKEPVDGDRYVRDTLVDRDDLIGSVREFEGLQVYVKENKKLYMLIDPVAPTWEEIGAGGGVVRVVTQVAHGFIPDNFLAYDTGVFVLANAGNGSKVAVGMVKEVIDVDNFVIQYSGVVEYPTGGLTVGDTYYLDILDSGITSAYPINFIQPLFIAIAVDVINLVELPMYIIEAPLGTVEGDMLKSIYDTNDDGIVDNSEKLGGQNPDAYLTKVAYDSNDDGVVNDSDNLGGQTPAFYTQNGLEKLGNGWRYIGRDPALYGTVGGNATDLSYSGNADGGDKGATGNGSFAANYDTRAPNAAMSAFGSYNIAEDVDSIFEIGIGLSNVSKKNVFKATASGELVAEELTIAKTDAGEARILVTREYLESIIAGLDLKPKPFFSSKITAAGSNVTMSGTDLDFMKIVGVFQPLYKLVVRVAVKYDATSTNPTPLRAVFVTSGSGVGLGTRNVLVAVENSEVKKEEFVEITYPFSTETVTVETVISVTIEDQAGVAVTCDQVKLEVEAYPS